MGNRQGVVWGLLLILAGAFFLATRIMPDVFGEIYWPYIVIGIGVAFLVAAILTRIGGLAVPAMVVGGIGGILYWQAVTGLWESWAYVWTLIPGFVGVGVILAGLLDRRGPRFDSGGLSLIAISAMGFLIFGSAFGQLFGLNFSVGALWPLFLIGIGVVSLISALFRRR